MITVAGLSPSLDLTYLVPSLTLGQISRSTEVKRCAGGKALNMARAAAALGASSTVVAVLGGATGEILRTALAAAGIEVKVIETPAETRTCVSIASASDGLLTEVYANAAPVPTTVWRQFAGAIDQTVQERPGWLSISGSAPGGLADGALADLVHLGKAAGVKVALDTHGPGLPSAVDAAPALIKVNRQEAAELLGVPVGTSLHTMAKKVRHASGAVVVLTDGRDGAVGLDHDGAVAASIPGLSGRFPVGSGDSFLGGLVTELDRGTALADALVTATAAGVANALVPGAGVFEASTVSSLRSQVRLRRL